MLSSKLPPLHYENLGHASWTVWFPHESRWALTINRWALAASGVKKIEERPWTLIRFASKSYEIKLNSFLIMIVKNIHERCWPLQISLNPVIRVGAAYIEMVMEERKKLV